MVGGTNLTIEELRARVAHMQQDLREMELILRGLEAESAQIAEQTGTHTGFANVLVAAAEQCGMDIPEPIGVEQLHALMLREGVRPEDNLLSQGVIEMRDE